MTWIAEHHVVFILPDGTRRPGRIAIAAPLQRAEDCACEVILEGLDRPTTLFGESTLQALLLAARFLGTRLQTHRSRGIRVVDPTEGVDVPLDAFFDTLLRHPEDG
jgi:hypothetical protein